MNVSVLLLLQACFDLLGGGVLFLLVLLLLLLMGMVRVLVAVGVVRHWIASFVR